MLDQLYELMDRGEWVHVKREAERLMMSPDLDYYTLGRIYRAGGRACIFLAEFYAAAKVLEIGLPYSEKASDWDSAGFMRHDLAGVHLALGDTAQARELYDAFLMELPRYHEARRLEGRAHYNLGLLYRNRKEYSLAVAAYRQALYCFTQRGEVRDTADCHQNLAWLLLIMNKPDEARIHIDLAASYQEALPDDFRVEQLILWAFYNTVLQAHPVALDYLRPIIDGRLFATEERKASARWVETKIHASQGDWAQAKEAWEKAMAHAMATKEKPLVNLCQDLKEELKEHLGGAAD